MAGRRDPVAGWWQAEPDRPAGNVGFNRIPVHHHFAVDVRQPVHRVESDQEWIEEAYGDGTV